MEFSQMFQLRQPSQDKKDQNNAVWNDLTLQENCFFQKYRSSEGIIKSAFKLFSEDKTQTEKSEQGTNSRVRRPRGGYRKYTLQEKELVVKRMHNGQDVRTISKQYRIPRRNLLRWKKSGYHRKEGGGRPADRNMENILYSKIKNQSLYSQKLIREEAIKISKSSSFKASKGWYLKFARRHQIPLSKTTP